jgi:hypothetical protein
MANSTVQVGFWHSDQERNIDYLGFSTVYLRFGMS